MERILVGYDGSEDGERAVSFAAELALRFDADLIIAHVMAQPGGFTATESIPVYSRVEEVYRAEHDVMREAADRIVDQAVSVADRQGYSNPTTVLLVGSPAPQLAKAATAHRADAVVVGSRGLGEFAGLLLGSVSSRLAHIAECTVITVK